MEGKFCSNWIREKYLNKVGIVQVVTIGVELIFITVEVRNVDRKVNWNLRS